jgi:hypothetical protein
MSRKSRAKMPARLTQRTVAAAMDRSALLERDRVPFFAHIDELQSFSTDCFASLLSEARKFRAKFCLANQ